MAERWLTPEARCNGYGCKDANGHLRPATVRWSQAAASLVLGVMTLFTMLTGPASAQQQVIRNGFESEKPSWIPSGADAVFEEQSHKTLQGVAHDGQRSEFLKLFVKDGPGNFIFYQYPIGKGPISDEFSAGVWVKANRPGIQLMARIILPHEPDPKNLEARMSTYIRSTDVYRNVGRWQRLELSRTPTLTKQLQQLMQAQLKKAVDFTDVYIDGLVLNVYGGPGNTELWIDDLEVGPVLPQDPIKITGDPALMKKLRDRKQVVEFDGTYLLTGGKKILFRGIRNTNTPLRILRDAGFNTVFLDAGSAPATIKEAVDLGFWLAPQLRVLAGDANLSTSDGVAQEVARYLENDAVLFWDLGSTLTFEQSVPMSRATQLVKSVDPGRPLAGDVWDGLMPYSRNLNLIGIHRWPLMTTLELTKYHEWLTLRRRLGNPGAFTWTWIQTHMPEWYTQLLYNQSEGQAFNEPVGPQAEHLRLLTYTALAAGTKGLGFWSDRWLADSHSGRDRLLACALLNMELDMLEPFLNQNDEGPQWFATSAAEVKTAVLRSSKGILALPIWMGNGAQFVPGQGAVNKLVVVVPQIPQSMQAWEVTLGEVRSLKIERVMGGTKVVLPDFGLTKAIVFTSDNDVVVRFQEQARARRQLAAQWTYDQAVYEVNKVRRVQDALEKQGKLVNDAASLMQDTEKRLQTARQLWENRVFAESYREAERALRPLRILMRAQWEQAVKQLDTPVASPYAISYFSLPRHWQFKELIDKSVPTQNVLPGGDFEIIPQRVQEAWKMEDPSLDNMELTAERVAEIPLRVDPKNPGPKSELPREGKQCAKLQIKTKNNLPPPPALERTLLALNSPVLRLPPGSLVQVSGWIRIPEPIHSSADGVLFYDSAGGEPLAVRLTEPTPWKKFTLYRRVPSSGTLQVTLALTGIGVAYFDDIRVEPLVPSTTPGTPVNATVP